MDRVIQSVGQRLKELRSQKSLTLEEVAERSGCTPGFLSQIERNKAVPSISMLYAIAEALDARVSDFFQETISAARIVRHQQRESFHFEGSSVTYSLLSTKFPHAALEAFLLTVIPAREALPTPPPEEKPAPPPPKPAPPQKDKPAPVTPKPPKPAKTTPAPAPKPPPVESEREPAPRTAAQVAPAPGETPSTGTDVATIKTPGLAFPFPEYLRNIVTQVYQRWDRASAKQSNFAEISFLILRDGSVRDIHFVTRSGSFAFDIDAHGAIEAAGNSRAFGQLPDGWEADVLPVSFYFKPTR